jgi:uncharacterized membrane protein
MRTKAPLRRFTVLGVLFLVTGIMSILSIAADWHFGQFIPWQLCAYAAMDFLLTYGFFNAQRWLPLALGLNWGGGALLGALKLALHTTTTPIASYVLSFCLAGVVWYLTYQSRAALKNHNQAAQYVGIAFILVWAMTLCSGFISLLQ